MLQFEGHCFCIHVISTAHTSSVKALLESIYSPTEDDWFIKGPVMAGERIFKVHIKMYTIRVDSNQCTSYAVSEHVVLF